MITTTINITATIFGGIAVILGQVNHLYLSITFGVFSVSLFLISLFVNRHENKTRNVKAISKDQESKQKPKPIKLTTNHKNILQQFKINDGELLSAESLEYLTDIDSFNVHLVLDELLSHGLIYATNLNETEGWLHVLSESGRKFIAKNLT